MGNGNVTVAAVDDDAEVYTRSYVRGHGWGAWTTMTEPGASNQHAQFDLAAVSPAPGVFDLYWEGAGSQTFFHAMTRRMTNGHWGATVDLGGKVDYLFASYLSGRTDLWAQPMSNNTLSPYQRTMIAGRWDQWHRLPY